MSINARAREIADIVFQDYDDREPLTAFFQRRFGGDSCRDGADALELCMARERGIDDLRSVLDLVEVAGAPNAAIRELVEYRRAKGYSAELEAVLSRTWICSGCGTKATLLSGVLISITRPGHQRSKLNWPSCVACGEEIAPIDAEADLSVVEGGRK